MLLHWSIAQGATDQTRKTIILVGTVLEVEIGMKGTALDRCRTFAIAKFDHGGGDIKEATINIRSFKLHTLEPTSPYNGDDGGERAAAETMTTTGYTAVTYTVSVQVF